MQSSAPLIPDENDESPSRNVHRPPLACANATEPFYVGLVDEPTVADCVATRPGGVAEKRSETLHPPVHGDMVDLDPPLGEQLLDIAIREPEP
jgi:hypothetical protein